MNPEPAEISAALLVLEKQIDSFGWSQPTSLVQLHLLPTTKQAGFAVLLAQRVPIRIEEPAEEFLTFIGERFTDGSPMAEQITSALAGDPSFYAMALVAEVAMTHVDPDEAKAWVASGLPISAHPDAFHARVLTAVDIHGRSYCVHRVRGAEAELVDTTYLGGPPHHALLLMIRGVVARLPEGRGDPLAVLAAASASFEEAAEATKINREPPGGPGC